MIALKRNLMTATRLPVISRSDSISAVEVGVLLLAGGLAACLVCFLHLSFRVPGHAILRAVVPMALGLALVPRRSAGTIMAASAGLTAGAFHLGGLGRIQPAAVVAMLALGPMIDLAMSGQSRGWRLYGCFALAGIGANLLACASHFFMAFPPGRHWPWPVALGSFLACGAVAGLISAALWFRLRE
jgi:hypothetical protein